MRCKNCQRELPNKDFKSKTGCIWCDIKCHVEYSEENRETLSIFHKLQKLYDKFLPNLIQMKQGE